MNPSSLVLEPLETPFLNAAALVIARAFNEVSILSVITNDLIASCSPDTPEEDRRKNFIARRDDDIIGVAQLATFGKKRFCWLDILAIDPAFQRQGIGHHMMRLLEDHINRTLLADGGAISLSTAKARSFYEDLGFREDEETGFSMTKQLPPFITAP